MEKVTDIIESIANEKGLEIEEVKERVKLAFIQTAKQLFGEQYLYDGVIDPQTKKIKLYQKVQVVADDDERISDNAKFMSLKQAKEVDKNIEIGDEISYDINIENLGRTASMVLSRELNYHIQRLLEEKILQNYTDKVGTMIHGTVTKIDHEETTFIEIEDFKAFIPRKNRIKGESFKVGDTVRAVIRRVYTEKNQGIKMELSRTSPKFLEALLISEVPEIRDGSVVVQACARIPGQRAKIALSALSPSVDPVGATVGTKGVRINAISKELRDENIDAIEYSNKPEIFVSRAMSPAITNSVKIDGNKAIVYINSDQKSKAIGKNGLNIRLATTLTGYEIELIESDKAEKSGEGLKDLKALIGGL